MSVFKIKVNHDNGSVVFTVNASSEEAARKMVCNMERCPECAVESCELVK